MKKTHLLKKFIDQKNHFMPAHLARFKVPKEMYVRDGLPRNPSGKVLKRRLREEIGSRS